VGVQLSRSSGHLLAVFALHNLEEVAHLPHDLARHAELLDRLGVPTGWRRRDLMAVATTLLTSMAFAGLREADRASSRRRDGMAVAIAAALGGNAVTHGVRAAADRAYNGGLGTSPVMLLAAVRVAGQARRRGQLSGSQVWNIAIAANAAVPPLVLVALAAGDAIVGVTRSRAGRS